MPAPPPSPRAPGRAGWAALALGLTLAVAWRALEPAADLAPLARSLHVALVAALTAMALGVLGGWLHTWRLPAPRLLLALSVAPLVVPPFLVALGWVDLLGPGGRLLRALGARPPELPSVLATSPLYTTWSCGLLLGAALSPIPLLAARAALLRVEPATLEAARLGRGRPGEARVALAGAWPAAVTAAGLVFALTLLERATPLLVLRGLLVPVQVEEVAIRFAAERDPWLAARAALPLVAALLLLAGGLALVWRRPGRAAPAAPRPLGPRGRALAAAGLLLLATPGLFVPLTALGLQLGDVAATSGAGPWAELRLAFRLGAPDAWRSALVGAATAALVVAAGAALAWPLRAAGAGDPGDAWRRAARVAAAAGLALLVALAAVPPPLVGAALDAVARAAPALDPLSEGPAIVVVACAARFAAVGAALLVVALRRLPPEEEEAARLGGRSPLRVVVPQALPAALAAALVVHVLTVTEYGACAVVEPPGASLLAVFVVNEAHYGAGPALAGLLTLLLVVAAAPPLAVTGAAGAWRLARRRLRSAA